MARRLVLLLLVTGCADGARPFGAELDGGAGGAAAMDGAGGQLGTGGTALGSGGAVVGRGGAGTGGVGSGGALGSGGGPPAVKLRVQYQNGSPGIREWSFQTFNIISAGAASAPLADLTVRYWFDDDRSGLAVPVCNSAWMIGCSVVAVRVVPVVPARRGASHYLEIGFVAAAPSLPAGGQTADIETSFHYEGFGAVDRMNDYSHDPTATVLRDSMTVTAYHRGSLVWGVEP